MNSFSFTFFRAELFKPARFKLTPIGQMNGMGAPIALAHRPSITLSVSAVNRQVAIFIGAAKIPGRPTFSSVHLFAKSLTPLYVDTGFALPPAGEAHGSCCPGIEEGVPHLTRHMEMAGTPTVSEYMQKQMAAQEKEVDELARAVQAIHFTPNDLVARGPDGELMVVVKVRDVECVHGKACRMTEKLLAIPLKDLIALKHVMEQHGKTEEAKKLGEVIGRIQTLLKKASDVHEQVAVRTREFESVLTANPGTVKKMTDSDRTALAAARKAMDKIRAISVAMKEKIITAIKSAEQETAFWSSQAGEERTILDRPSAPNGSGTALADLQSLLSSLYEKPHSTTLSLLLKYDPFVLTNAFGQMYQEREEIEMMALRQMARKELFAKLEQRLTDFMAFVKKTDSGPQASERKMAA